MSPNRTGAYRFAAPTLAAALLCVPAIFNGFPLAYDDVGGYLERWPTRTLGFGRSAPYGLALWLTRSSWWIPVIITQAMVTTWVINRALKVFGHDRSPSTIVYVVAAIASTSGAAFFVSQVMPDAWIAPAVLALHLLAWHADQLTRIERAAMAAIVAVAAASHMAILGTLAGVTMLNIAARLARRRLRIAPAGIALASLATCCGIVLLLATNFVVAGRLAFTPGGDVFLFGRLVASGIVGKVLAQECPRSDWQLCAFRHEMPAVSDDLLWDTNSPLYRIGGPGDPRVQQEITSIIARSMLTHPLDHLEDAALLTSQQFVTVGTANNMSPVRSSYLAWTLELYAPWLVAPYNSSRQQSDDVDLTRWSAWIVAPVSILGSFALPFVALLLWRRNDRRAAMLPAMIFLALVGNAFICGVVSGPSDRYQARLAWLAPLAVALTVAGWRNIRSD